MTDYTNLGLDSNLRPLNSPATNYGTAHVTGYGFNSNYERNTITAMNIRDFSFSTGEGGTLTLGGAGNGNGVASIKNSGGTEIVRLDNTGIEINNGDISINSASGSVVIDSSGLNSISNFRSYVTDDNSAYYITSSTYVPLTDGTVGTVVVSRQTRALIYLQGGFYTSGNIILTDGTINYITTVTYTSYQHRSNIVNISAGTHVLIVKGKQTSGTLSINSMSSGCVLLGY